MGDAIRLLIADDHAVVRRGLRLFLDLQPDMDVVGEAVDGADAVARAVELEPDVVLMDVVMPSLGGIDATAELRERSPRARVLALSSYSDGDRVLSAVRAGVAGYMLKETEPEQLADAIRAVHRGEAVLCREAVETVVDAVAHGDRRPEGTLTIVMTDVEGSTTLLETLGEASARELLARQAEIVRAGIDDHRGVEVEREGDAFLLAFTSARSALEFAVETQRRLEESGAPRVRMGVNTGEVVVDGDRLFGRAIFVTARVAANASGAQILVTELTRALVGDAGFRFHDRGSHELKGFAGGHRLYEVEWTRSAS